MALNTLHIASDGYLKATSVTLGIAVRGYLGVLVPTTYDDIPKPEIKLGGGSKKSPIIYVKDKEREDYLLYKQINQEEEEILLIIKTFLKCQ